MKVLIAVIVLASPLLAAAQNQTVWRCGADGRSYSDQPCSDGRVVAVADTRDLDDVAAARLVAERERRLAAELRHERLRRESQPGQQVLLDTSPPRPAIKPAKSVKQATPKRPAKAKRFPPEEPGTWQAVVPASRRTKG